MISCISFYCDFKVIKNESSNLKNKLTCLINVANRNDNKNQKIIIFFIIFLSLYLN